MSRQESRAAQWTASRYLHLLPGPRGYLAVNSLSLSSYDLTPDQFDFLTAAVRGEIPGGVDTDPYVEAGLLVDDEPAGLLALSQLATARRQRRAEGRGHFTTMRLAVTEKCNMACSYCFQQQMYSDAQPTMSRPVLVDSLDWFIQQGRGSHLTVQYFGGEPLLEWDHVQTAHSWLEAAQRDQTIPGFRETLTTNGTLLTRDRATWMAERNFDVTVSFDGPPAQNDKNRMLRSGRGTFRLAERGLRNWVDAGGQPAILMTATRAGLHHLPEYVRWFVEESGLEPATVGINSPQPTAQGWETGGEELAEVIWNIWQYCNEHGVVFHGPGTFIAGRLSGLGPRIDTCVDTGPGSDSSSWPVYVSATGERSLCVIHHRDNRAMAAPGKSTREAALRWHNLDAPVSEACDRCIASQICGGPCAVERILWGNRLSRDRCGLMQRMTELVLTEG